MKKGMLVVVPCGKGKIWDRSPGIGGVKARDAYTGPPFMKNREYAEKFGEKWVILSAKYGYIMPDFIIPGNYNVTFKDAKTQPIGFDVLRKQVQGLGLDQFDTVVGLGGKEYRAAIMASFPDKAKIKFPFEGLPLGRMMSAISLAIEQNNPFPNKASM